MIQHVQLQFAASSFEAALNYTQPLTALMHDATQNLLQNQPLVTILINDFFSFVSCTEPGQNFAIKKYDFSREISQNSAGFFL